MYILGVKEVMDDCGIRNGEDVYKFIEFGDVVEKKGFSIRYFSAEHKDLCVEVWNEESPAFNNVAVGFKTFDDMMQKLYDANQRDLKERVMQESNNLESRLPHVVYNSHGKTYLYDSFNDFVSTEVNRCRESMKQFDDILKKTMSKKNVVDLNPDKKETTNEVVKPR